MAKWIDWLMNQVTSRNTRSFGSQRVKIRPGSAITAEEWIQTGNWISVRSSNVKGIMYDFVKKTLYVQFLGKGNPDPIYKYYNVPQTVAKSMFTAPSMGKFVWRHLRDKYDFGRG